MERAMKYPPRFALQSLSGKAIDLRMPIKTAPYSGLRRKSWSVSHPPLSFLGKHYMSSCRAYNTL